MIYVVNNNQPALFSKRKKYNNDNLRKEVEIQEATGSLHFVRRIFSRLLLQWVFVWLTRSVKATLCH